MKFEIVFFSRLHFSCLIFVINVMLRHISSLILTKFSSAFCFFFFQVEIDGQVLGKGIGLTWDEAKLQVYNFIISGDF